MMGANDALRLATGVAAGAAFAIFSTVIAPVPVSAADELSLVIAACIGKRAVTLVEVGEGNMLDAIEASHLDSLAKLAKATKWYVVSPESEKAGATKKFDSPKVVRGPAKQERPGAQVEHDKVVLGPCTKEMEVYATRPIQRAAAKAAEDAARAAVTKALFDHVCPPKNKAEEGDCPRGSRTAAETFADLDAKVIDPETALYSVRFRLTPATGDGDTRFFSIVRAPTEGQPKVMEVQGAYKVPGSDADHTSAPGAAWIEADIGGSHKIAIVRSETTQGSGGLSGVVIYDLGPTGEMKTVDVDLATTTAASEAEPKKKQ